MSDTPRTDAFQTAQFGTNEPDSVDSALLYFSRELERELAEADKFLAEWRAIANEASETIGRLKAVPPDDEALSILRELHTYLDFHEPMTNNEMFAPDNVDGINGVFAKAYALLSAALERSSEDGKK